jgi:TonB family protein
MNSVSPKTLSIYLHVFVLVLFFTLSKITLTSHENVLNVPVVYSPPAEALNIKEIKAEEKIVLKSVNENQKAKSSTKEVFGLNRNTYTDDRVGPQGIEVKKGNTIAKVSDNELLKDTDSDSLPTPTEEYLVSQMPRVLSEVKPIYPSEAKNNKIEGAVVLNVLIDEKGVVRQVDVIDGPEIFKIEALQAMKKFKFSAAMVSGKAVAVKIRYVINFKLEY